MSRRQSNRISAVPPAKGPVTIRDVAARAGVSTATVSRVLSGSDGVGKQVSDRVLAAVRALDYHPNRLARDLRVGLRKVIGVVIPDLQNPFYTSVVHGIEAVLCREGYSLLLAHSNDLAEREESQLALLRGEGAAGLVLIPNNDVKTNYQSLRAWNIPVAAVDRAPAGLNVDLVRVNNREAMCEATRHMVGHGYKEIAFINGPARISVAEERRAGYGDALAEASLSLKNHLLIHSDFHQEGGHAAMTRLLALARRPRAVLIANNLMTLGALQAIHEHGLQIPDEIAVLGFDDMPWATSLNPPLTAVAQPAEEIGRVAAQLLLDRLADPSRMARQVILPARLVTRTSCGPHPPKVKNI
jgi:DNA-binding LacI/PurR family transcriptional regulator